jgi:nicotinamide mononucleotide adenylyltransferase
MHEDPQLSSATANSENITPSTNNMEETYTFPDYRLRREMKDSSKTPLLLVACGSFSPITYLHLRMFEMAADFVKFNNEFEIVGGVLSPVSDAYKKAGLASAEHRYIDIALLLNYIFRLISYLVSPCAKSQWTKRQIG